MIQNILGAAVKLIEALWLMSSFVAVCNHWCFHFRTALWMMRLQSSVLSGTTFLLGKLDIISEKMYVLFQPAFL